jgi:hypothetical protein
LNLSIPMRVHPNMNNLPKPHIIFKGSRFWKGEDWDALCTKQRGKKGMIDVLWKLKVVSCLKWLK